MNKVLVALVAIVGMSLFTLSTRAADEKKGAMQGEHSMTGVLIDNACGDKQANEADAAKHKMACSKKDSCAASGYQLIVGDKHYKFDDKGNDQAKAYLEKADTTHVTVMGTMEGDNKIDVSSIKPAEAKG